MKGEKKTAVAAMIKKAGKEVRVGFNVLHVDPQQVSYIWCLRILYSAELF